MIQGLEKAAKRFANAYDQYVMGEPSRAWMAKLKKIYSEPIKQRSREEIEADRKQLYKREAEWAKEFDAAKERRQSEPGYDEEAGAFLKQIVEMAERAEKPKISGIGKAASVLVKLSSPTVVGAPGAEPPKNLPPRAKIDNSAVTGRPPLAIDRIHGIPDKMPKTILPGARA